MRISDWSSDVCSSDLLVLVDPVDSARLPDVLAAGATHSPAEDLTAPRFATALAFAGRHVERLGGGRADLSNQNAIQRIAALFWRYAPAEGRVTLRSALAMGLATCWESRCRYV